MSGGPKKKYTFVKSGKIWTTTKFTICNIMTAVMWLLFHGGMHIGGACKIQFID